MRKEKLGNIIKSLESGGRPKGGAITDGRGVFSIGAEHLDGNGGFDFNSKKYIPEDYFKSLKKGKVERDNILIVKDGATTGKVSFVGEDFPFDLAAINEHVFSIKVDKSVAYPKFIFQYLKSIDGNREVLKDFRGATVGGISRAFLDFVNIPLLPLNQQIEIAEKLTQAETLINQRKQSIALLDEYLKSTFLEMFGEIIEKSEKEKFENYIEFLTSGSRGWAKYYSDRGDKFLRIQNIGRGVLNNEEIQFVNAPNTQEAIRTKVKEGDLLITITADLGRTAVIPINFGDAFINQHIALVRLNNKLINPTYAAFFYAMPFGYSVIQKKNKSAVKSGLTFNDIKSFPIVTPTLKLQNQFARIVSTTESLKAQYKTSLQELENLYAALSQKAFKGELAMPMSYVTIDNMASKFQSVGLGRFVAKEELTKKQAFLHKLMLAAHIVYQLCEEKTFGHTKLMKLLYLCEQASGMALQTNYKKFAAGPFDGKMLTLLDLEFQKNKWFEIVKTKFTVGGKEREATGYRRTGKSFLYQKHFNNYFASEAATINKLIDLFRKTKTDIVEIVATLYYTWREMLVNGVTIDKTRLVAGFYQFHPEKKKFTKEQILSGYQFMVAEQIHPEQIS